MPAPAFTSVTTTHHTLGGPRPVFVPPSFTSQPPPQKPPPRVWPTSVRQWVQRSFAEEPKYPDISPADIQAKLKQVINAAIDANLLDETDWATYPPVQQLIVEEKTAPMAVSNVPPPMKPPHVLAADAHPPNPDMHIFKKRKVANADLNTDHDNNTNDPPRQKVQVKNVFEDRVADNPPPAKMTKAEKRQRKFLEQTGGSSKSNGKLEERRNRFDLNKPMSLRESTPVRDAGQKPLSQGPIVGTCEDIFKDYFRLCAPPEAKNVRPLRVLRKTLDALITRWKADNNYNYICGQFKSLRQDITVQRINNDFTTRVYELHARIALEMGDLGEYNQCQTQLRGLYKQKLGGRPGEFLAYRILYFLYTRNRTDMSDLLASITPADRADSAVQHALQTRSALALGNYHKFFQLYLDTPNLGAYLMDKFIVRERLDALARICKSYKQHVLLRFISEELAFESDEQSAQFICEYGGEALLDRFDDGVRFATAKAGRLFEDAKTAASGGVDIKGQM